MRLATLPRSVRFLMPSFTWEILYLVFAFQTWWNSQNFMLTSMPQFISCNFRRFSTTVISIKYLVYFYIKIDGMQWCIRETNVRWSIKNFWESIGVVFSSNPTLSNCPLRTALILSGILHVCYKIVLESSLLIVRVSKLHANPVSGMVSILQLNSAEIGIGYVYNVFEYFMMVHPLLKSNAISYGPSATS